MEVIIIHKEINLVKLLIVKKFKDNYYQNKL